MPVVLELREEMRSASRSQGDYEERRCERCSQPRPLLLGLFHTPELARAAVSARLQPLFGGADCFTAPCPDALDMQQRSWEVSQWHCKDDDSEPVEVKVPFFEVVVSRKRPEGPSGVYPYFDDTQLVLTVTESQVVVDQPPLAEFQAHNRSEWRKFLEFVRPPPPPLTAEEQAAKTAARLAAAIKLRLETYLPGC